MTIRAWTRLTLVAALPVVMGGCGDDGSATDADTSSQTESSMSADATGTDTDAADSETTGEPLPDLGPAPDDHCPNPGPWPLPPAPELQLPKFVEHSYIDLGQVGWVTKFRSSVGHDYSDGFEHCRSMKHYAYPLDEVMDWGIIEIYAPVSGEVIAVEDEMFGERVQIRSELHPEFDFLIWHVELAGPLAVGAQVVAGELLGTHYGVETYSDISVATESQGELRLVSWFELMSPTLLAEFQARGGVSSPEEVIITQAQRDAMALCCTEGQFDEEEDLADWVALDLEMPAPPPRLGLAAPPEAEAGELGFRRR